MSGGTRFALLTPPGAGGVAVVAVSGPGRWDATTQWLRSRTGRPLPRATPPDDPSGRQATAPRLAWLWLGGELVDQVLVVERATTIEWHLHGSPAVLAAVEQHVGRLDRSAPATPAERLLREALSEAQVALALEQRAVDFAVFLADLAGRSAAARAVAGAAALARTRVARALAEPERVVLCGAQNAGKSTLLNRLLFRERALVGDLPGLTRDPVRERVALAGYPYELVDTAGEGDVDDALDRRAVALARRERAGAWKLVVVDGSRVPGALEAELTDDRALVVRTKADLPQAAWPALGSAAVSVHALDPAGAPEIRATIGAALRELRDLPVAGPVGGPAALDAEQEERLRATLDEGQSIGASTGQA